MGICLRKPQDRQLVALVNSADRASKACTSTHHQTTLTQKLRSNARFRDVYKIGKMLGEGGHAFVNVAIEKTTGQAYAVKVVAIPEWDKALEPNSCTLEDVFKEIDILAGLDHPHVITLKEFFVENGQVCLITELFTCGELADLVLQRGCYSEDDARECFVQLLKGIDYLHANHISHRDLKLENILVQCPAGENKAPLVKIADFGLAKKMAQDELQHMRTQCGTPQYVAPEVIMGTPDLKYGPAVDLWSAGVVLFILLAGYPPFFHESEPALYALIRKGDFTFDDPIWDTISERAKQMVKHLLEVEPGKRPTAAEALQDPWCLEISKEA